MSEIVIKEYTQSKKDEWNTFIAESNNGTIFHNMDFLSYHQEGKFDDRSLMFYKGSRLIAVLPMAVFVEGDAVIVKSPYGASFGGIVGAPHLRFRHSEQIVDVLMRYFIDSNFQEIYITPPPSFYHRIPNNYIEFNMLKMGFTVHKREITNIIALDIFYGDPLESFEKRARTAVRKALKSGVSIVSDSKDYDTFYEILLETKKKHNAIPTHTVEELKKIAQLVPNNVRLDMAYLNGEPIAGCYYILCNPKVNAIFYTCYKSGFEKLYPLSLLVYHGIKWSKEAGFEYIDFGTSTKDMAPRSSLFMFKEAFGAAGVFWDTYKLEVAR